MINLRKLFIFFLVISAVIPAADASYITMKSSITATDNAAAIIISNLGDEPSYNVQLSLDANGKNSVSDVKKQLNVRESFRWQIPLHFESKNPGKYPLVLTTNYQDANSYPFSAISVFIFDNNESTISSLAAMISNVELADKGVLELKIKNTAETAKDASIRLIAPKELTADKDSLNLHLASKEQATANFEIEKFSALKGSSYAVFAVIEYDEGGRHYTSTANGLIKIIEKKNIFANNALLAFILIALIIIFVYFQFKKKK